MDPSVASRVLRALLLAGPFIVDRVLGHELTADVHSPGFGAASVIGFILAALAGAGCFIGTMSITRGWWSLAHLTRGPASLTAILSLAAVLRLWIACLVYGARYDMGVYEQAGDDVLAGRNLYRAGQETYFYLPGIAYLSAFALWTARQTGLTFHFLIKLPAIAADLATITLVWRALGGAVWGPAAFGAGQGPRRLTPLAAALVMAINPISLGVTAVHGQFDPIGAALLLGALLAAEAQSVPGCAVLMALATYAKNWPLMFAPPALLALEGWRRRLGAAVLCGLLLSVLSLTFVPGDRADMVLANTRYPSNFGWWGPGALLVVLARAWPEGVGAWAGPGPNALRIALVLGGLVSFYVASWSWADRRRQLLAGVLVFATVSPSYAPQYSAWAVPVLVLAGGAGLVEAYLLGTGLWLWFSELGYICSRLASRVLGSELAPDAVRLLSLLPWAIGLAGLVAMLRGGRPPRTHSPPSRCGGRAVCGAVLRRGEARRATHDVNGQFTISRSSLPGLNFGTRRAGILILAPF